MFTRENQEDNPVKRDIADRPEPVRGREQTKRLKTIRRSPITRATALLVTLAMVAPALMGGRAARAQSQQATRVIIADIVNKSPGASPTLGITATAAIYNEMVNSAQGRYSVIQNSDVLKEAQSLGLKVPSNPNQPANFTLSDLKRIATNLNAEAIVEGQVAAGSAKNKTVQVALLANIREVASDQFINGGYSRMTVSPRPGDTSDAEELINKGVSDAAQDLVRQVLGRQLASATVIGIETNTVILNKGIRDGVHVGDNIVILREGAGGKKTRVGSVKVARAYPTDSEAEIISNPGGITPEDGARVVYQPPVEIVSITTIKDTSKGASFNLSAIGATVSVIALGVLVASASRGGQTSTTGVTAEAGVQNNAPIVRVRWSDNIFGQGNVQQYKIYREPDFPFGQSTGGGNNGGGNNGGGAPPIGVQSSTVHEFFDHGSPFFPYATGLAPLVGTGNGNPPGGGGNNGGGNNGGGCSSQTVAVTLDTGFKPGSSYHYLVTAIILRQTPQSGGGGNNGGGNNGGGNNGGGNNGGGNNGGGNNGGGNNGGGNNGGGGNGGGGGSECIETDPSRSGQSTPINPVLLTSPANNTASVNVRQFAPQFTSRNGADVFQIEVSPDRTFMNPSLIFRQQLISSAPNADGVAQTTLNPIDLTQSPELMRNSAFNAFVAASQCNTRPASGAGGAVAPTLYYRVGARHDGDTPGPIHAITMNSSDSDKTFRFVYSQVFAFTPAPLPPCPPGNPSRTAALLNTVYTSGTRAALSLRPGQSSRGAASLHTTVQSPQDILMGGRRKRN